MIEHHLAKLRARDDVTPQEEQAIRAAVREYRVYPADHVIIKSGDEIQHSTLLLDGMMCRYKDLNSGKRQITELHVAGDFVDLHSFTLKYLDHDIMAITPCRAALVPHKNLERITEQFPHLTRLYWFHTNLDAAIHREWELSLGRRDASAKVTALFSELHIRLRLIGLADERGYQLPLTQTDIAECLGLTNVHVNRTLKELRERGIVEFQMGRVTILDRSALWQIAEFDPAYLYLSKRAR